MTAGMWVALVAVIYVAVVVAVIALAQWVHRVDEREERRSRWWLLRQLQWELLEGEERQLPTYWEATR